MRDGGQSSEIHFTSALRGESLIEGTLLSEGLMKRSDDFSRPYQATTPALVGGAREVATTKSRKRDASARYSAIQDTPPASPKFEVNFGLANEHLPDLGEVARRRRNGGGKAGGTTRRPLVLQMDRGRILFRTGGAPC